MEANQPSTAGPTWQSLYTALADDRCREVLRYLEYRATVAGTTTTPVAAIARVLDRTEAGCDQQFDVQIRQSDGSDLSTLDITPQDARDAMLHHAVLPRLADAELIEITDERVHYRGHPVVTLNLNYLAHIGRQ